MPIKIRLWKKYLLTKMVPYIFAGSLFLIILILFIVFMQVNNRTRRYCQAGSTTACEGTFCGFLKRRCSNISGSQSSNYCPGIPGPMSMGGRSTCTYNNCGRTPITNDNYTSAFPECKGITGNTSLMECMYNSILNPKSNVNKLSYSNGCEYNLLKNIRNCNNSTGGGLGGGLSGDLGGDLDYFQKVRTAPHRLLPAKKTTRPQRGTPTPPPGTPAPAPRYTGAAIGAGIAIGVSATAIVSILIVWGVKRGNEKRSGPAEYVQVY